MKIVKFFHENRVQFGVVESDTRIRILATSPFAGEIQLTEKFVPMDAVELLAPTVDHPRVFGVGFNYKSHIVETGRSMPEIPPLFMKPDTSLIAHKKDIVYPKNAQIVHFEAELVVVIGSKARNVETKDALKHVLGYCCGNDVSERIFQRKEMAMGLMVAGKGFDTFAPVGPWIETEVDPTELRLRGILNGVVVQESSTSDLLFGAAELVSYISSFATLLPGDLIMTGTPAGIGALVPGDVFEVEISGIGSLINKVRAEN